MKAISLLSAVQAVQHYFSGNWHWLAPVLLLLLISTAMSISAYADHRREMRRMRLAYENTAMDEEMEAADLSRAQASG